MSTVSDIFTAIDHRIELADDIGETSIKFASLNTAVRLVSKRLRFLRSSLVRGDLDLSVSESDTSVSLPSDFWGLMDAPYVDGELYQLEPLPDYRTKLVYTSDGQPLWYEIVGTSMYIIPPPNDDITIKGPYWSRPTKLTATTDTMPWNELFDDVIQEYLVEANKIKPFPEGELQKLINDAVDEAAGFYDRKAPTPLIIHNTLDEYYD